jgi:NTP pyrophosphatase (non-canonical NTP hydrolase)
MKGKEKPQNQTDSLKSLTRAALAFRDRRDWAQFHSPKELAISLAVESAELLQLMQWWKPNDLKRVIREKHPQIQDELADVFFSVLLLADELKIDLGKAFLGKLTKTGAKYPVRKSKGSPKKYNEL